MRSEREIFQSPDQEYRLYSDQWFLNEYLKNGSVEESMRFHKNSLPISYANFHRLVKSAGIVKSVGRREVSISEVLYFFAKKALSPAVPLEQLYKNYMPIEFGTSVATLHRIYDRIWHRNPQRFATALVISSPEDPTKILVGEEMRTSLRRGKRSGDISLPMGFSQQNEDPQISVLRVLQREFSTRLTVNGDLAVGSLLTSELIPNDISPFLLFDIVDVRVGVYHLNLPQSLGDLSKCKSYNIGNHKFLGTADFSNSQDLPFRIGVGEMISEYYQYLGNEIQVSDNAPKLSLSYLNQVLLDNNLK